MATLTSFYIYSNEKALVVEQLRQLSGITTITELSNAKNLGVDWLLDDRKLPTYLAVGQTNKDWVAVVHNSFNKLESWCVKLSLQLQTKVIVTMAQSVSDVYYFALYDSGRKLREIEVCYSGDDHPVNYGEKFDFEEEEPGRRDEFEGEVEYFFGFEEMEHYCQQFGLEIQTDYSQMTWTVFNSNKKHGIGEAYLASGGKKPQKPWWKFW